MAVFDLMSKNIIHKIRRKWMKLRLQPIRVFCLHHVSDGYNPLTMWECDWTPTEQFKQNILQLKKQYSFISLNEAHEKLRHDWFRRKKYAVLTADDGYKSILNILPWLEQQQIPISLFINTKYLDKKSWSAINEEQAKRAKQNVDMLTEVCPDLYISKEELFALTSPLISIGIHGHEHVDATKQTIEGFRDNVEQCRKILKQHARYVPFFAYTWGHHTIETDEVLKLNGLIPVMTNEMKNYNNNTYIDRECLDGITE